MAHAPTPPDRERFRRELTDLLAEIKVAFTAVVLLFGFLLTLPFSGRFEQLTRAQDVAYMLAFLSTALAVVFMLTPSAFHRMRWRQHDKDAMLRASNRLFIGALGCLVVALASSVLLVGLIVTSPWFAWTIAAVVAALSIGLWFVFPVSRRLRGRASDLPDVDAR